MSPIDNNLLPLWYKEEKYPLFPIRRADADMLLFNCVWDVAIAYDYGNFFSSVTTPNFRLRDIKLEDISLLLLFPGDDPTNSYVPPILGMPCFVGVYGVYYGPFDLEEDDFSSLYYCFRPEWALDGSGDIIYNNIGGSDNGLPSNPDNSAELQQAIRRLLDFLREHPADTGSWVERLNLSLQMLAKQANPFHILHNAGLYDIDALWTLLLQAGLAGKELLTVSTLVTRQLHRYAMRVVNIDNPYRRKP